MKMQASQPTNQPTLYRARLLLQHCRTCIVFTVRACPYLICIDIYKTGDIGSCVVHSIWLHVTLWLHLNLLCSTVSTPSSLSLSLSHNLICSYSIQIQLVLSLVAQVDRHVVNLFLSLNFFFVIKTHGESLIICKSRDGSCLIICKIYQPHFVPT